MDRLLRIWTLVVVMGSICLLSACGSSGRSASQASVSACQHVTAVLSDGPDPGADPVGYAESQILPLRQIHTTDQPLQLAVDRLASAYETFFDDDGSFGAKEKLTQAASSVNALCPGAGAGV